MPLRTTARARRRGAAAVELAVLLPFLMYLAIITADWARLLYFTITLSGCARSGALYEADSVAASQSGYADSTAAALAEAPGLSPTPTVTRAQGTDSAGNKTVAVTVSMPFTTITNFPGVPSYTVLTRTVQMRVSPLTSQ